MPTISPPSLPDAPANGNSESNKQTTIVRIAIIVGGVIIGIGLLFLLGRTIMGGTSKMGQMVSSVGNANIVSDTEPTFSEDPINVMQGGLRKLRKFFKGRK
jgi:hypothetical protein